MKEEHKKKLGRLFAGGPAAWEAFKEGPTPESRRVALDKIVRDNTPFIASCVRSLKGRGLSSPMASVVDLSDDDLLQAGRRGYVKALEHFDPAKGALPKYAKDWIRNEVQRTAAADATIHKPEQIRLPAAALRAGEAVEARTGRDATAEEMGVTPSRLKDWRTQPTVCPIDQVLPVARIPVEDPGPEELLGLKELATCAQALPPRQREVIRLLFWEGMSPEEVADELDITAVEEVLNLRDEALAALHDQLS